MSINVFLIQQIFFSEKWQGASVASYRVRVSQVTYSFKTRKDVEQGTRSGNTDSCRNRLSLFLLRHTLLSCAQQHPSLFVVSTRIDKHAQLFMTNIRFVFIGVSVCVCGSQLVLESLITVSFRRLFACSLLIDFSYQKKIGWEARQKWQSQVGDDVFHTWCHVKREIDVSSFSDYR